VLHARQVEDIMGRCGHLPWDSDAALDSASTELRTLCEWVESVLSRPLGPKSTEADLSLAFLACDFLCRLAPYWECEGLEAAMDSAFLRLDELQHFPDGFVRDPSYLLKLRSAFEAYRDADPLRIEGVPLPPGSPP